MKKVKREAIANPARKQENTKAPPQHQGTAFLQALGREPLRPTRMRKTPACQRWNALRQHPTIMRKHGSPVRQFSVSTAARQGPPIRPLPLMQRVAGAKAIPDAAGRTERRSRRGHHPGHRPGKVRANAPCDTRRTRYSSPKETPFALPQKGSTGVQGGVEGPPLSPHAPRRAGDPPPVPGAVAIHRGHRLNITRAF